jgi:hypothetical protein
LTDNDQIAEPARRIIMPSNSWLRAATLSLLTIATLALAAPALAQQPPATQAAPLDQQPPPPPAVEPPPQVEPPLVAPSPVLPSHAASTPSGAAKPALVIANVNLRSGPRTDSLIIATIPGGSRVRVAGCSGEWCAVTWNGTDGYAIARNLDTSGRRQDRRYRPQPFYEPDQQVVYGPPVYYPPPAVVYGPGFYYGPRYYYGRRWGGGGWHGRW